MGFQSIALSIAAYMNTNWSATPVQWPNTVINVDDADGDFSVVDEDFLSEWVSLTIGITGSNQAAISGSPKLFRSYGLLTIQVFTPLNEGNGRALELTDLLCTLFREVIVGVVQFKTPYPSYEGRSDSRYQINVSCPFYTDEQF